MARLFHVDTFTEHAYGGAPVPVIVHQEAMTLQVARHLTTELGQAVTAFLRPSANGCDIRFFEADEEVGVVGSAALAAAFVALRELYPLRDVMVLKNPLAGDLPVSRAGGRFFIDLAAMPPRRVDCIRYLEETLPNVSVIEQLETPFGAIARVADEDAVRHARPDLAKALEVSASTVIVTAPGTDVDFVSRVFAPKFALPEDPVCGTAHRILAPYWADHFGRNHLSARQLCDRGGDFDCRVNGATVRLGGHAVLLFGSKIHIPPAQ